MNPKILASIRVNFLKSQEKFLAAPRNLTQKILNSVVKPMNCCLVFCGGTDSWSGRAKKHFLLLETCNAPLTAHLIVLSKTSTSACEKV